MTRQSMVARRAEALLGAAVVATAPVAGGDVNTATRVKLSDGRSVLMKTHPHAPPGFFAAEARSLRMLADAGGLRVPEVLAVDDECLVLPWIERGKVTNESAATLGEALARTHLAGAEESSYGAEEDGWIGRLPMPNGRVGSWPEFYATRRVLPYLKLARDRGAVTDEEAAAVEAVLPHLGDLVPDEPPAVLHGDLWNGNVLWAADGIPVAIDPAAYVGHREVDLAMLALFGLPQLPRVMDAYESVAPLADGFEDRVKVHQLFPLLVHACMFGGGYGARAAAAASSLR
jgi:fructosamine-3-kinase